MPEVNPDLLTRLTKALLGEQARFWPGDKGLPHTEALLGGPESEIWSEEELRAKRARDFLRSQEGKPLLEREIPGYNPESGNTLGLAMESALLGAIEAPGRVSMPLARTMRRNYVRDAWKKRAEQDQERIDEEIPGVQKVKNSLTVNPPDWMAQAPSTGVSKKPAKVYPGLAGSLAHSYTRRDPNTYPSIPNDTSFRPSVPHYTRLQNVMAELHRRLGPYASEITNQPEMADLAVEIDPLNRSMYQGRRAYELDKPNLRKITVGTEVGTRTPSDMAAAMWDAYLHELSHSSALHDNESVTGEVTMPGGTVAQLDPKATAEHALWRQSERAAVSDAESRFQNTLMSLKHSPRMLEGRAHLEKFLTENPDVYKELQKDADLIDIFPANLEFARTGKIPKIGSITRDEQAALATPLARSLAMKYRQAGSRRIKEPESGSVSAPEDINKYITTFQAERSKQGWGPNDTFTASDFKMYTGLGSNYEATELLKRGVREGTVEIVGVATRTHGRTGRQGQPISMKRTSQVYRLKSQPVAGSQRIREPESGQAKLEETISKLQGGNLEARSRAAQASKQEWMREQGIARDANGEWHDKNGNVIDVRDLHDMYLRATGRR